MSTADNATTENEEKTLDLQVEVSDAGPCLKHVQVTIPRHEIDRAYADAVENLVETAAVPGFRPGHVPPGLVRKRFREELKDEVRRQLLLVSLEQVSEEHELNAINQPDLDPTAIEIPDEGDFEYEFDVEVRPDFTVPDYSGLRIERPPIEISEQEVDRHLKRLLDDYGTLVPQEGAAEEGDALALSAVFSRDGETLHTIDEFTARLRPVLRFQDAELENFGELFRRAEIGAKRAADVTVSSGAATIELRGESVHVEFELLDLKRPETPETNSALFDRMGVENLEELRERVEESLERQADYRERQNARSQVLSKITESANWELPESLVNRQVENALRREILEMQQAGFSAADIRARENELRQNAISSTRQALKEHFVLDRIAEEEEIEVDDLAIEQEIMMMALQQGESPRRLRSRLHKSGMVENLEAQLRERKAIDFILSKAEYVDIPAPEPEPIDQVAAVPHSVSSWSAERPTEDESGEVGEGES